MSLFASVFCSYLFLTGLFACFYPDTKRSRLFLPITLVSPLASSRRSVSWGAARKTAREKIKKCAARGSERTPLGKLNNNERSFRYQDVVYLLTKNYKPAVMLPVSVGGL